MANWTPTDLTTIPRYIFDPSAFTYSGSAFSSGLNSGSVGGSWALMGAAPNKGADLNGITTLEFTGAQGFVNNVAAWPAGNNVFVFYVAKVTTQHIGTLIAHSWGSATTTTAWIIYPRIGTLDGAPVNDSEFFQGFNYAPKVFANVFTDSNFHIVSTKLGTAVISRDDGAALAPSSSTTGTINLSPSTNCNVGAPVITSADPLVGTVAYITVIVDPTTDEVERLEGWAAWRFGLVSNLDAGHPYKSAAPQTGSAPQLSAGQRLIFM